MRFPFSGPSKEDVWQQVMRLNRHYMRQVDGKCPYEPQQCQDLRDLEVLEQHQHQEDEIAQRQAAAFEESAEEEEDELLEAAINNMARKEFDKAGIEAEWKSLAAEMAGGKHSA
jgi:hypothetical protein